mgnify:CR=1 FL=1
MANDPTTDTALNPFFGTDLDRAKDVLDWLWDHRDDVMDLANRLPKILEAAGQSMSSAGDGATSAASLLIGTNDTPGAAQLTKTASETLLACQHELERLNALIDGVAEHLDNVNIPGVSRPFDKAAAQLREGAKRVDSLGDAMVGVAGSIESLGGQVGQAAVGLQTVGEQLGRTGTTLGSLLGGRAAKPAGSSAQGRTASEEVKRAEGTRSETGGAGGLTTGPSSKPGTAGGVGKIGDLLGDK